MIKYYKNALFAAIFIFSVLATYWSLHNQLQVVHILSDSMAPSIKRGDLLIVKAKATTELNVGDIAILPSLTDKDVLYSHRIIQIKKYPMGEVVVKTKGDANSIADDSAITITSKSTPVSLFAIHSSNFLNIAPDGKTFALLLIIPIVYRFFLVRKYKKRVKEHVEV